eukprot:TRINITY_DN335_c0_g1_i2.p1 TRINITY_DN335_c0_g1~~TRINITY_DN335_c0_g1_i2.p1  ORF type:complete len:152 (+),score=20.24 TRINITY_DN335_c0_g1_i2:390-845(+)
MATQSGELVATHGPDDCIFCKIIRGELPSYKLLETDHAIAFLDAFPMREGHVLLVPKTHAPFITDLSPEDTAQSLKELPRVAQAVQKAYGAEGISVAQNNGAPAGQVVFHVHFHIFPREKGDGLLKWSHGSKSMLAPDEAKRVQEKIRKHV